MDPSLGSLALVFVNTVGSPTWGPDAIATPESYAGWHAKVLPEEQQPPLPRTLPEVRRLTQEAARLRAELDTLFELTARRAEVSAQTLFVMNRVLSAGHLTHRVVSTPDGPRLHSSHVADALIGALAPIVLSAIRLVEEASASRLRRCASARCSRWFLDTSKGGRRRWCSMSVCGNRAKAARFRERHGSSG